MDEWIRWALGLGIIAVGWFVRLERRLNSKVDRELYDRDAKEMMRTVMACLEKLNERGETRDEQLAVIGADVKRVVSEIGTTTDTGLRGAVHRTANRMSVVEGKVDQLIEKKRS